MKRIIPIASGKGGVGKSSIASNLGVALAKQGKTTVLVDLDLGGSNLHTFLGIKNSDMGLGSYITQKNSKVTIENLVTETAIPRLFLIQGDSLLPGTANLPYYMKKRILTELSNLVADYIILDLGSGTNFNVLDFFLCSTTGFVVTVPEPTSLLNSYSLIKGALFRKLFLTFPRYSKEREMITNFFSNKLEGTDITTDHLLNQLFIYNQQSAQMVKQLINDFYPRIIINMGRADYDLQLGAKLREIVFKNLRVNVEYFAFLPQDDQMHISILKRQPIISLAPQNSFSQMIYQIAQKVIQMPDEVIHHFNEEDTQDIQELQESLSF